MNSADQPKTYHKSTFHPTYPNSGQFAPHQHHPYHIIDEENQTDAHHGVFAPHHHFRPALGKPNNTTPLISPMKFTSPHRDPNMYPEGLVVGAEHISSLQ